MSGSRVVDGNSLLALLPLLLPLPKESRTAEPDIFVTWFRTFQVAQDPGSLLIL